MYQKNQDSTERRPHLPIDVISYKFEEYIGFFETKFNYNIIL